MSEAQQPARAGDAPVAVEVEAGKEYYWCVCGRSANQPYCDGSHTGTPMAPQGFVAEQTGTVYLCLCKNTANPPYCDGSHQS